MVERCSKRVIEGDEIRVHLNLICSMRHGIIQGDSVDKKMKFQSARVTRCPEAEELIPLPETHPPPSLSEKCHSLQALKKGSSTMKAHWKLLVTAIVAAALLIFEKP